MKLRLAFLLLHFATTTLVNAQTNKTTKPKLMIGLVVDQMRWDYLYRYQNRYGNDGFKRLLNNGFSYENTFIPYAPTVTAAGHSCLYTGSTPAITGIMGNAWYDKGLDKMVYCTDDSTVQGVGTTNASAPNVGKMSPRNLLTTTITDELKLSNNKASKVVGVCIKDRGGILPAGHAADLALWYDGKTGNWITSSFYTNALPNWVTKVNESKLVDSYYKQNWHTLLPISTYTLSTADEKPYEGKFKGATNTSFPHQLDVYVGKDYEVLPGTPYGNTYTLYMAQQAIINMNLGKNSVTDFLAVSLSSPDYIGHRFGPNSIEIEDTYLRLDREIATFLQFLDKTIGANKYTLFLSADHGVAHVPSFLKENKIPAGNWDNDAMVKQLNVFLKNKFNTEKLIVAESNYQLYLNDVIIRSNTLDRDAVIAAVIRYCKMQPGIADAFDLRNMYGANLPYQIKEMLVNGYHNKRAGDIQILLEPGWIDGGTVGTTHGLWNPYDSHIPMVWFGAGIRKGKSYKTRYMTDVATTIAALLQIQMPNSSIGEVMDEALQ